jgi:hypothetical protein
MQGGNREHWRMPFALARSLSRISAHLERQRRRGRTPATDALAGFAIEDGEAEGLIGELFEVLRSTELGIASLPISPIAIELAELGDVADLPLARAVVAFELTPQELDAVMLAIAVELDARFARLVAYVNDHVGKTRPTLGLAYALEDNGSVPPALLDRPFVRDGLVELEGDGPLSGLVVKLSRAMLARLAGEGGAAPEVPGVRIAAAAAALDRLVLDPEVAAALRGWADAAAAGRSRPRGGAGQPDRPGARLVLGGPTGVGRTTAARAALGAAGVASIEIAVGEDHGELAARVLAARREARWHAGGIVVCLAAEWRDRDTAALWAALAGVAAPVAIVAPAGAVESIAAAAPVEPVIVEIAPPELAQRARLWRALAPEGALSPPEVDELAARFEFTPRSIARTIRRASGDGSTPVTAAALHRAAREVGSAGMSSIAQRLPLVYARGDLVLPPRILSELDLAIAWIRHKRHVFDTWGFGHRVALGRGLTALFSGPPGTGKTMTAQVLARDLGLDLYRVDLSRVMSKYIGETEKNLSRLFDQAQASGAVLFFDEADALFGKRSEVRDAHDRYANVEIGYLLQRMEEHEGAAILATNRVGDLDEAFLRRFHFLLDFPMPDASYRLRLWQGMLPREVEREADIEPGLGPLAASYELSGGEIRNCVLAAAYMAAAEGSRVGLRHLERGLRRELHKTGRIAVAPRRRVADEEV